MFVRLLVMLISHIICCFSGLMCCRSFVQFMAQKGEIKQSWNLSPCQCDRAHLVQSSALRSSSKGAIECMPSQQHITCCPSRPWSPSLQHLRHGNSKAVTCDWSHTMWTNAMRSNAQDMIKRTRTCDRAHRSTFGRIRDYDRLHHLRSSALLT